jgi:hypothetical protein
VGAWALLSHRIPTLPSARDLALGKDILFFLFQKNVAERKISWALGKDLDVQKITGYDFFFKKKLILC